MKEKCEKCGRPAIYTVQVYYHGPDAYGEKLLCGLHVRPFRSAYDKDLQGEDVCPDGVSYVESITALEGKKK